MTKNTYFFSKTEKIRTIKQKIMHRVIQMVTEKKRQ